MSLEDVCNGKDTGIETISLGMMESFAFFCQFVAMPVVTVNTQ